MSRRVDLLSRRRVEKPSYSKVLRQRWSEDGVRGIVSGALAVSAEYGEHQLRFGGKRVFDNRSKGSQDLLIIAAGYKEYLWPWTLGRMARYVPSDFDVCLCSAGVHSDALAAFAREHGWSYLSTTPNRIALPHNIAIDSHRNALRIHKLDEDIFVSEGYFETMVEGYERFAAEGAFNAGFAAPVLNVNGFSYKVFLETMGLVDAYRERFDGELKQAAGGVHAHYDGEAALWLWEHTLPFDETAARFAAQPYGWSIIPHRFSIGAIYFERNFWEMLRGFRAPLAQGVLGVEEEQICMHTVNASRAMFTLHNVLAGHFAFGPQEPTMRAALDRLRAGLGDALPVGA